mmetsp:Transcript_5793/g.18602  ORF Transcript_5793/g.18602 Transcript_5793/m.18602 type:complete len:209 (+) Transcript_5793:1252-1878(+)
MSLIAKMWMLVGTPFVAAYFVYIWAMYAPDFLVGRRKAALPRPFIQVSPTPSPSGQGVYFDEALGEWIKVAPDAQSGKENSMRPSWLLLMGSSADWAMNLQVVLIVHPAAPLAIFWIALISVAAPLVRTHSLLWPCSDHSLICFFPQTPRAAQVWVAEDLSLINPHLAPAVGSGHFGQAQAAAAHVAFRPRMRAMVSIAFPVTSRRHP